MGRKRRHAEPDRERAGQAGQDGGGDFRLIGEVAGVHALAGELKVDLTQGEAGELAPGQTVRLTWRGGASEEVRVRSVRSVTAGARRGIPRVLLGLEGVEDRTAAEGKRRAWVWVATEPEPLADDELYWSEVVGLPVRTPGGETLGTVAAVDPGGQTRLVIERPDGHRCEVPAVEPILVEVDLAKGQVVMDPPPGLLEA